MQIGELIKELSQYPLNQEVKIWDYEYNDYKDIIYIEKKIISNDNYPFRKKDIKLIILYS